MNFKKHFYNYLLIQWFLFLFMMPYNFFLLLIPVIFFILIKVLLYAKSLIFIIYIYI